MNDTYVMTSECVSRGHPDKVADQISDAILDRFLGGDPYSKVAIETLISPGLVVVAGEVKSAVSLTKREYEKIVISIIENIGYSSLSGFDTNNCNIIVNVGRQSQEINSSVTKHDGDAALGAGDQGLMFGYATNETPTFMPLGIYFSRGILDHINSLRKSDLWFLRPDAKSQVSISYSKDGIAQHVDTVVVSLQHNEIVAWPELQDKVAQAITNYIQLLPENLKRLYNSRTNVIVNPSGLWTIGGPAADTGVTGRKIVVDNYGADCEIGGGAFSGKDPSKVDRSAAYAARFIAKNLVSAGIADKVKIQLAYVIGDTKPVSIRVNTMGTSHSKFSDHMLGILIGENFSLSPADIISYFELKNPIYWGTAAFGHFGVGGETLAWEKITNIFDNLL